MRDKRFGSLTYEIPRLAFFIIVLLTKISKFLEENRHVLVLSLMTTPSTKTSMQILLHKKQIKINFNSAVSCD